MLWQHTKTPVFEKYGLSEGLVPGHSAEAPNLQIYYILLLNIQILDYGVGG
jgi:hypothetical protein